LFIFLIAAPVVFSCRSTPVETTSPVIEQAEDNESEYISGGVADEIRGLVETGLLSSMTQALELIRSRELGGVDFGRMMNGIITVLVKNIYPDSMVQLPIFDLPQTYSYSRILREAERGVYVHPLEGSSDFFEYVLPFLAINGDTQSEILVNALSDLSKAGEMRPLSVLPPYFRALIFERMDQLTSADAEFKKAHEISGEFYPALTGIARIMSRTGRRDEAITVYSNLIIDYPDSLDIKRQLAITYYDNRDWSRAGPAVDELLQSEPRNGEFLLMRAHILIEQGSFTQANAPLDSYASISANNANNRSYLFLRARIQAEGNRNRDSALNYLRSILRHNPDDEEAAIYAARLLMESQRPADQAEGRELLRNLQQTTGSSIIVLSLSLRDAIQRENWREAQTYLNRILIVRRTTQDLTDAYYVERGVGNNARALAFARELYERDTSNNDYVAVYISALIDNGRRDEASRMLESRLSAAVAGNERGRYYYLRSRLQNDEESTLADLRSSIFEDPRNLDALIAMFEIYHRRREERRAVHYLRQALAIAPDNPRLRRYEREYSTLLGR
jgi:tetratricopeptide (TPR) repeat protein